MHQSQPRTIPPRISANNTTINDLPPSYGSLFPNTLIDNPNSTSIELTSFHTQQRTENPISTIIDFNTNDNTIQTTENNTTNAYFSGILCTSKNITRFIVLWLTISSIISYIGLYTIVMLNPSQRKYTGLGVIGILLLIYIFLKYYLIYDVVFNKGCSVRSVKLYLFLCLVFLFFDVFALTYINKVVVL